ncbi:MAG: hypothetical protein CMJ59_09950 [Planctomycetaceae bacterium]|nr:hypothetical protein [Planctomycetaceae bacterium]
MTLMGKIFTMLVLVLSVLFLGLSITVFVTHRNWKDEAEKQTKALSAANIRADQISQLRDNALNNLKFEQAARRAVLANLQTKQTVMERDLADRTQQFEELQNTHRVELEKAVQKLNDLDRVTQEVELLRTQIMAAHVARDKSFEGLVEVQDKLNEAQGMLKNLSERRSQLLADLSEYKRLTDVLNVTLADIDTRVPKGIDGMVTKVGERDLVEISLGSDDGLRIGHELHVTRDNSYLGKLRVQKTSPDRSVAIILKDFRQGIIRTNDRVYTSL